MIVLGIDPGTIRMGYGVVEEKNGDIAFMGCGALDTPKRSSIGERLYFLYRELLKIMKRYRPEVVAVETPFVSENIRTALAIGRAQALALLAAAAQSIPCYEYTPARIKQVVASHGASTKEQVQEMVRLHLNLAEAPQPHDAADALAVAICHFLETRLSNLIAREKEGA